MSESGNWSEEPAREISFARATQILAGDIAHKLAAIQVVDEPPDTWPSRYSITVDGHKIGVIITRARYRAVIKLRSTPGKQSELSALRSGQFQYLAYGWRDASGLVLKWVLLDVHKLLETIGDKQRERRFGDEYVLLPLKQLTDCLVCYEGVLHGMAERHR